MENDNTYKLLAEKIEKIMEQRGVSQTTLAAKIGVSDSFVSKFFRNGNKITVKRLLDILDALGREMDFPEKKTLPILAA